MSRDIYYQEFRAEFDSAMKVPSGMVELLNEKQQYAMFVSGFLNAYDPGQGLPPARSRDIAARFWEYGYSNGFTTESIVKMAKATKLGYDVGGVVDEKIGGWGILAVIVLLLIIAFQVS